MKKKKKKKKKNQITRHRSESPSQNEPCRMHRGHKCERVSIGGVLSSTRLRRSDEKHRARHEQNAVARPQMLRLGRLASGSSRDNAKHSGQSKTKGHFLFFSFFHREEDG